MAMVQGEEMEEGEVTEDGELSDIRYVFSLPCLPYFCSVTTRAWKRARSARRKSNVRRR